MKINNLIYRLIYFLRKEKVFSALPELRSLEKKEEGAVRHYKEQKLVELLEFAKKYIDFYNKQQKNYIKFYDIQILDKHIIRNNINKLRAKKIKVAWRSTSGTTGAPLVFPKDKQATAYMDAMMYCVYSWHNISFGDKQARLWGRALNTKTKFLQYCKDLILNRKRLSAFEMSEDNCFKFYNKLIRFKPNIFILILMLYINLLLLRK